jgi:hypothetical protein
VPRAGVDDIDTGDDVVAEVEGRFMHGFADEGLRGEVEDSVDGAVGGEERIDGVAIHELDLGEGGVRVHGFAVAEAEVVGDEDGVAGSEELFGGDAADVAGAASNEHVHGR